MSLKNEYNTNLTKILTLKYPILRNNKDRVAIFVMKQCNLHIFVVVQFWDLFVASNERYMYTYF